MANGWKNQYQDYKNRLEYLDGYFETDHFKSLNEEKKSKLKSEYNSLCREFTTLNNRLPLTFINKFKA